MKNNDEQLGIPETLYKDTKANIEALTNVKEGMIAYATNTDAVGTFDGTSWVWIPVMKNIGPNMVLAGLASGLPTFRSLVEQDLPTHQHDAGDINSDSATDGYVLTADGAGGAAWEITEGSDGWTPIRQTCTYVSTTSFRISGDVRTQYPTGTKIKLTQTTVKYFYVVSTSYTSSKTTITVTGGSNYSLANAAITNPFRSYMATPQLFPHWMNWTPTVTGYSSVPTNAVYRFSIDGRKVYISVREVTSGISNATSITISLPVTAATITNQLWMYPAAYENNGVVSTTWGRGVIVSGDNKVVFGINPAQQDGFTASGKKRISAFDGWYEF